MNSLNLFLQFLANGVVTGAAYVLVAIGLTLIFGILNVVNFAHGEFYMLGGYAAVTASAVLGFPLIPTLVVTVVFLAAFGMAAEWLVFRPISGRDPNNAIIASFGLSILLQNGALVVFGAQPQTWKTDLAELPVQLGPVFLTGQRVLIVLITVVLVAALLLVLRYTWTGRALRAVADDHAAAQSVGISLNWIWFVVWLMAGLVALAAATVWGTKLGVQFSITFLALKALPVLIIGGFTSVPGAIIGGLLIGAGEKLAEAYLGPAMGGGIEYWFAYVLALVVLLMRPQGLFGERIIERI